MDIFLMLYNTSFIAYLIPNSLHPLIPPQLPTRNH